MTSTKKNWFDHKEWLLVEGIPSTRKNKFY